MTRSMTRSPAAKIVRAVALAVLLSGLAIISGNARIQAAITTIATTMDPSPDPVPSLAEILDPTPDPVPNFANVDTTGDEEAEPGLVKYIRTL